MYETLGVELGKVTREHRQTAPIQASKPSYYKFGMRPDGKDTFQSMEYARSYCTSSRLKL